MPYQPRPYSSPSDQLLMVELCNRFPAQHLHISDLPYRFSSWALEDAANARLWFDAQGGLAGWAALQSPFWTIDYACQPAGCADLLPEMLAWAEARARALAGTRYARPCWFVDVFADCAEQIRVLEAAGFASQADASQDAWSKVWLERPGDLPVEAYRIPPGFRVRPLAGEGEVQAYVDLHQAVFESKNMNAAWRRRTLQHPDYRPELDLVVEAPDGRLAAFCIAWLNKHGREPDAPDAPVGQIEPLGLHADFRHLALGRLALAEALRRLQSLGAQSIYVETDKNRDTAMRLYEHMGFQVLRDVLVFRKDL